MRRSKTKALAESPAPERKSVSDRGSLNDIWESEDRFQFEVLLTDILSRFVSVASDRLDAEILDAQRRVCEHLGLEVSSLWEWHSENPGSLELTHLYRPPGGPPVPERMDAYDSFPYCLRKMMAGELVVISSLDTAPSEAVRDVETWKHFGIKTTLTVPLSVSDRPPFGALSFNSMTAERTWPAPLVERLELVAKVFAGAIVRKRAEQNLQESEEQLSVALEAAGAGAWSMDARTGNIWASFGERKLFEFPPDMPLSLDSFMNRIYPDDLELVRTAIEESVRAKKSMLLEYRIILPSGSVRWIAARGRPQYDAKERLFRLAGVSTDISDRKKKEEAFRSDAARLESAVDLAELGFYEMREDNRTAFLDQRSREFFGVPPEEEDRSRKYWLAHIHAEDLPRVLRSTREVLEEGRNRGAIEYRYMHPSRGLKWFSHLSNVLERNAAGRATHVIGVVRDITERKRMETALDQMREDIARLTRVATMGELTAALAHELNQPLAAIMNNASAARRMIDSISPDLEEIREILVDIIADDERAGDIIRRVRGFISKNEPELESLDVNEVIGGVGGLVQSDALIRGVRIRLQLTPDLPTVRGDRIQLQQVLLNLIINAFDAMKDVEGERILTVQTKWQQIDGVVVTIQDSGPGVPPDKTDAIFEPFFSSKPGGMGMGLAICRTIIESLGGRIWAENDRNHGAIIHFTLPAAEATKS